MKNTTTTKMPVRNVRTAHSPSWSKVVPLLRFVSTVLKTPAPRMPRIQGE
jgi:hypothetical protein